MTDDPFERLRELRAKPFNFLSRTQSTEGHALAFRALEALHADRRLPSFRELEEIITNPHALTGFHDWCQRTRRFAIWTQEAIAALADYLRGRGYERIVELGAGRGDLSWHLANAGVSIEATDAGPEVLGAYTLSQYRHLPVEVWENVRLFDWRTALKVLGPDCVLVSWMPPDEDWTPQLRAAPGLREHILFWELRGTTGGKSAFRNNPGWRPRDLIDVEDGMVGRTDEGLPNTGLTQYTKVTAFTRTDS
jgi:hypothetical protein